MESQYLASLDIRSCRMRAAAIRKSALAALGLLWLPSQASATLSSLNTYFGYTNTLSSTINTNAHTSNGLYASLYGNDKFNLFVNGGFEFGNTNKGADGNGWGTAADTNDTAFFSGGRPAANTTAIPGWSTTGSSASNTNNLAGGPYGLWGHETYTSTTGNNTIANSAPLVQGSNAVYFGDWIADPGHGGGLTTGNPLYTADGRVNWNGTFNLIAGHSGTTGSNVAIQLSQTITGLLTNHQYIYSFWTSGEDVGGPANDPARSQDHADGVFGLTVSGEPVQVTNQNDGIAVTQLLSAAYTTGAAFDPATTAGFNGSHYYQYILIPTSSTVTFTWTNWGHIQTGGNATRASELVLDDVVLFDGGSIDSTPEPAGFVLAGMGLTVLLLSCLARKACREA